MRFLFLDHLKCWSSGFSCALPGFDDEFPIFASIRTPVEMETFLVYLERIWVLAIVAADLTVATLIFESLHQG